MQCLMKATFAIVVSGMLVSACSTPVPPPEHAQITFTHLAPLNLNVSRVEVKNEYRAEASGNHVEDRFPVSPATALERWATDRLKPVGGPASGVLRLIVTDASVVETGLKKDESVTGVFTHQQNLRYDLDAGGRIEIRDSTGTRVAFAAANATRSITTREDLNLNEREKIWFDTTEKLMGDFNREMERNIRQYLSAWLR